MATKREGKAPPLISICPSNRDHGYGDMAAKHRTQNPKKGGDGHSFPPFGELPSSPDLLNCVWVRLVPAMTMALRRFKQFAAETSELGAVSLSVRTWVKAVSPLNRHATSPHQFEPVRG